MSSTVNYKEAYEQLEGLAQANGHYSKTVVDLVRNLNLHVNANKNLISQFNNMQASIKQALMQWEIHHKIDKTTLQNIKEQSKCIKELEKQYKQFEVAMKLINLSQKTFSELLSLGFDNLGKFSGGIVRTVAALGGFELSQRNLTETLLTYNRTVFEGMKIGERYGDSTSQFAKALETVKTKTGMSRQEFAQLNLTIKQMSVGIPMTSQAVADLAANLSNNLGWSAEKVAKSMTDMISIQNKLPSLFERIKSAQEAFAVSTTAGEQAVSSLVNKMEAVGASRQEIEGVLDAVTKPKINLDQWMDFEKSISNSKRDIKDASLEIAEKMRSGLEIVNQIQATIAKGISSMPKLVMLVVSAAAAFGVQLAMIVKQLKVANDLWKNMSKPIPVVSGVGLSAGGPAGGSAGAGGQSSAWIARTKKDIRDYFSRLRGEQPTETGIGPIAQAAPSVPSAGPSVGRFGAIKGGVKSGLNWAKTGGMQLLGGGAMMVAGDQLGQFSENSVAKYSGGHRGASAASGALSRALMYGKAGAMIGTAFGGPAGTAIGAGVGAGAGLIHGAISGWRAGDKEKEEQAKLAREQQEASKRNQMAKGAMSRDLAKGAGIDVGSAKTHGDVLVAIGREKDEKKRMLALEAQYRSGLLTKNQIQGALTTLLGSEEKARQATNKLVISSLTGLGGVLEKQMQIRRVAEAVTQELENQNALYKGMSDAGSGAMEAFKKGMLGSDLASVMGKRMLVGLEAQASNAQKKLAATFARNNADNPEVQMRMGFKNEDEKKAWNEQRKELEKFAEQIGEEREKFDQERVSKTHIGLDPDAKAAREADMKAQLDGMLAQKEKMEGELSKIEGGMRLDFDLGFIDQQMKKSVEAMKKLYAEKQALENSGQSGSKDYVRVSKSLDDELNKQKQLDADRLDVEMKRAEVIKGIYEVATAGSMREIGLQEKLIALGQSRLNIANSMGLPASYQALQQQVNLVGKEVLLYEQKKQLTEGATETIQNQIGLNLHAKEIAAGTMTKEQAMLAINEEAKLKKIDISGREKEIYMTIGAQADATKEMNEKVAQLGELTKTWREGWMTAMEETIIGAGDFAGVLGMANQNVSEKTAAGGLGSQTYGATNTRRVSAVDRSQAPRMTTAYGTMEGDIGRNPGMFQHTDVSDGVVALQKMMETLRSGGTIAAPVDYKNLSQQGQKDLGQAEAAVIGKQGGGTITPTPGVTPNAAEYTQGHFGITLGSTQDAKAAQQVSSAAGRQASASPQNNNFKFTFDLTPAAANLVAFNSKDQEHNSLA